MISKTPSLTSKSPWWTLSRTSPCSSSSRSLSTWYFDVTHGPLINFRSIFYGQRWFTHKILWTTPCPGPWGCRSHCSPGPSTWPLSHLKPQNSDSNWKIGIKTCIICIFEKNELLPVLVPWVAVLVVPLDPRYCLCHTCNLEIRTPIEKLAYKHVSYVYLKKMNYSLSWSLGLPFSFSPGPLTWPLSHL